MDHKVSQEIKAQLEQLDSLVVRELQEQTVNQVSRVQLGSLDHRVLLVPRVSKDYRVRLD